MGQHCSTGYVKVEGSQYGNRGQGGGDPRFGNAGGNKSGGTGGGGGGGGMVGTNKCVAIPIVKPNYSQYQGGAGSSSSNVFDTTTGRLGFISPIHT